MLIEQRTPLVKAEFHYRTIEIGLGDNLGADIRLFDMVYESRGRESRRVVHVHTFSLGGIYLIGHIGHRGNDVHSEFPEKPFLHYFQMKQPEKSATETESQRK